MNPIAWYADHAFHHVEPSFSGRKKHNNVLTPHFAIGKKRPHPFRGRRKLLTIYEYVVPDQQSVLHRTGRNLECLHDECDDEQARDEHSRQGTLKLDGRLFLFFFGRSFSFSLPLPGPWIFAWGDLPDMFLTCAYLISWNVRFQRL